MLSLRPGLHRKILTLFLDGSYLHGGTGVSSETQFFGMGLFEKLGFSEYHVPMESMADPVVRAAIRDNAPYDMVFISAYQEVEHWLRDIVGPATPILVWLSDCAWRRDFAFAWMKCADYIVTTDPDAHDQYHALGYGGSILSAWACRPDTWVLKPDQLPEKFHGATFTGFLYADRLQKLHAIADAGPADVVVHDTRDKQLPPLNYHQGIASRTHALCLTASSVGPPQFKARMWECQLHQTVLLTEPVPYLEMHWKNLDDCLVWKTPEQAQSLMMDCLANPKWFDGIRERALERILSEGTYFHRFRDIFQRMGFLEEVADVAVDPVAKGEA